MSTQFTVNKVTLSDAYQAHQLELRSRGLSPRTVSFYNKLLTPFIAQYAAVPLSALQPTHIRTYLTQYDNHAKNTKHAVARAIRAFLNFCVADKLIAESPFEPVKMPELPKKVQPALTNEEVKTILAACADHKERAICHFLLASGVRLSELIHLDFGDLDGETVHVRGGKGDKDRITFINAQTRKLLQYYHMSVGYRPTATDPLFITMHGDRYTVNAFATFMRKIQQKSGIKHCTAHAFRRTFATNMLRAGMDVYTLAKLMGHDDIRTLRHYLDLLTDDLEAAYKKYGAD